MKWTIFKIEDYKDNSILLLNTFNEALIELSKEEKEDVEESIKNKTSNENLKVLVSEGFLVDDNLDEKVQFMDKLKTEINNDYNFILHILPTTACNFKCSYCYQDGIERQHFLSVNDIKIIGEEINLYLKKYVNIRNLKLIIHGGEPTMNWKIVPFMMNSLQHICNNNNVKLMTSIVSNGYELTSEKIEFLKFFDWYRFQVTLDGIKEVHDLKRMLKNGAGTFDRIIQNIEYIMKNDILDKIDLRINYDKSNYNQVPLFLKYLSNKDYRKKLNISLGYITQTVNSNAHEYMEKEQFNTKEQINCHYELYSIATSLGLNVSDKFVYGSLCTSKLKHSYIISPDGFLYKCLSMVGRDKGIVDNWRKNKNCFNNYSMLKYKLYDKSFKENCPLIPYCHTDCRFDSLIKYNDINKVFCRKNELLELNKRLMRKKYENECRKSK